MIKDQAWIILVPLKVLNLEGVLTISANSL